MPDETLSKQTTPSQEGRPAFSHKTIKIRKCVFVRKKRLEKSSIPIGYTEREAVTLINNSGWDISLTELQSARNSGEICYYNFGGIIRYSQRDVITYIEGHRCEIEPSTGSSARNKPTYISALADAMKNIGQEPDGIERVILALLKNSPTYIVDFSRDEFQILAKSLGLSRGHLYCHIRDGVIMTIKQIKNDILQVSPTPHTALALDRVAKQPVD